MHDTFRSLFGCFRSAFEQPRCSSVGCAHLTQFATIIVLINVFFSIILNYGLPWQTARMPDVRQKRPAFKGLCAGFGLGSLILFFSYKFEIRMALDLSHRHQGKSS